MCFGRSLGGAVSIALADRFPHLVDGLIVENTFLSISAMVDVLMPFLKHLKHIALRINWDSDVKIQNLKQPIMFIAGESMIIVDMRLQRLLFLVRLSILGDRDELVPPAQMTELHKLASKSSYKDFYSVLGGSHNDTWDVAGKYYYKVLVYFQDVV